MKQGFEATIDNAMRNGTLDKGYTIDFGKLYKFLCGNGVDAEATLFGSRPPPNDGIWTFAERAGFKLVLEDRNIQNKEKKIDTGVVTKLTRDAYRNGDPKNDLFVLVSGDADYVPTVKTLVDDGYTVEVVFWGHASKELTSVASKFICLDDHLDTLRL